MNEEIRNNEIRDDELENVAGGRIPHPDDNTPGHGTVAYYRTCPACGFKRNVIKESGSNYVICCSCGHRWES